MASNPMQRKTRNSFLLGIVITLVITGIIIAILFLKYSETEKKLQAEINAKQKVFVLKKDVKAGQVLTQDMFVDKKIHKDSIPEDATKITFADIESWYLQTKDGEMVCRDTWGLYLDRSAEGQTSDTIMEIYQNTGNAFFDTLGNKVEIGDNYVAAGEKTQKLESLEDAKKDEFGMFLVDSQANDNAIRVYQEPLTGEYYVLKITGALNTAGSVARTKEYLEIKNVPVLARVDMDANTVITKELVVQSDEQVTDDTRQEQYNMITLPVDLMTNDYVDIRLKVPSGQNFIVVSKAQVEIPANGDGSYISNTIKVNLREDELLAMSSAIVEAYGMEGAELYATKYIDPAMQEPAIPTYIPSEAVNALMKANPNIVDVAKAKLKEIYTEAAKNLRMQYLQQDIDSLRSTEDGEEMYKENISTSVEENMGKSLTIRQKYLESLNY